MYSIYIPLNEKTVSVLLINAFPFCPGCCTAAVCTSVDGWAEWSADVAYCKCIFRIVLSQMFIVSSKRNPPLLILFMS